MSCNKCEHPVDDHEMIDELFGIQKWKCRICNHIMVGELR